MSLEQRGPAFKSAAEYATKSSNASSASNTVKLELYGLYKYLTVAHAPNTKCPSVFDVTGRAKWQAWEKVSKEYQGKSEAEVEQRYLTVVKGLGWKEEDPPAESKDEEPREERGGLGVSVSQVTRPPEDPKEAENSLHGAVLTGDSTKVEEYLAKAATGFDIDAKDQYGFTALHLAADRGHLPIVKVLVAKGANLGVKDPDDLTAISLAQEANHTEIVTYLENYLEDKGALGQGA